MPAISNQVWDLAVDVTGSSCQSSPDGGWLVSGEVLVSKTERWTGDPEDADLALTHFTPVAMRGRVVRDADGQLTFATDQHRQFRDALAGSAFDQAEIHRAYREARAGLLAYAERELSN
jgi:hypothetical protein